MEIAEGNIGQVAVYDVEFVDGKLVAKIEVPLVALVEPVLTKLEDLIPGQLDNVAIEAIKSAFLK